MMNQISLFLQLTDTDLISFNLLTVAVMAAAMHQAGINPENTVFDVPSSPSFTPPIPPSPEEEARADNVDDDNPPALLSLASAATAGRLACANNLSPLLLPLMTSSLSAAALSNSHPSRSCHPARR